MNLTFDICDIGNRQIRILDFTQEGDEYVPENLEGTNYSILRYFNYKYSETCTINVLLYNTSSKLSLYSVTYTDHSSYLDEAIIPINKDGYYTVYHMVLPTVDWLKDKLKNPEFDLSVYSSIYVTDGLKVYKVVNTVLLECDIIEITLVNIYNTTISRCEKELFHFYDLYSCYINMCNDLFNKSILRCPDNNLNLKDIRYNRDFIWSAINVIKFYTENKDYESALLLIEKLDSCNSICKLLARNGQVSGCGCGCS